MTNRSKLEALRASKLAVELSGEQCGVLSELIDFRDLKAGDVLVREGKRDNHLYVIVSGAVGVVKNAGSDEQARLLTLADGAFVDELSSWMARRTTRHWWRCATRARSNSNAKSLSPCSPRTRWSCTG